MVANVETMFSVREVPWHARPLRERINYRDSLFLKTIEGYPMINKTYQMALAAT